MVVWLCGSVALWLCVVVWGVGIVWVVWVAAKCDFSALGWLPPRAYPFPFFFLKNLSGGGGWMVWDGDGDGGWGGVGWVGGWMDSGCVSVCSVALWLCGSVALWQG